LKDYFSSESVGIDSKSNLLNKLKTISPVGHPDWSVLVDYCNGQVNGPVLKELPRERDSIDPELSVSEGVSA
jgi:hypothetical protein